MHLYTKNRRFAKNRMGMLCVFGMLVLLTLSVNAIAAEPILEDDFEGENIDTQKWDKIGGSGANFSIGSGKAILQPNTKPYWRAVLQSKADDINPFKMDSPCTIELKGIHLEGTPKPDSGAGIQAFLLIGNAKGNMANPGVTAEGNAHLVVTLTEYEWGGKKVSVFDASNGEKQRMLNINTQKTLGGLPSDIVFTVDPATNGWTLEMKREDKSVTKTGTFSHFNAQALEENGAYVMIGAKNRGVVRPTTTLEVDAIQVKP